MGVSAAVTQAIQKKNRRARLDTIKLIAPARLERRPARLDLTACPLCPGPR
jgi:hypothetical protein